MAVILFSPFILATFIYVVFPAMFFPRHRFYMQPSLLLKVAAFRACYFRRFIILGEQVAQCLSRPQVALDMYSKWQQFELHPRSISTQA